MYKRTNFFLCCTCFFEFVLRVTQKKETSKDSLDAVFDPLSTGHFFDIQSLPHFLSIELNWRLLPTEEDSNSEIDIEKHIQEESEEYLNALKVLEETQSMACFHGKEKILEIRYRMIY